MITTLQKVGIEGNYLNIIKAIYNKLTSFSGSPVAQLVKKPPAVQETWVQSLGWEDPMEKGKATHSNILG